MIFKDAVVVVTGAGGGMGRTVALAFEREGAKLALMDASSTGLMETVSKLQNGNVPHETVDIRDVSAIRLFMGRIREELGPASVLANCAGVWHEAAFDEVTEDNWNFVVDVNLKGNFFLCQEAMKQMKEAGGGSVVNIASTAGEYGSIRPAAHYAASKGGIIAMSKSLAREGAPSIRVNVISPGPTDTPMLANTEEEKKEIAKRPLVGRLGTAHDMASAILYLSDPGKAGYITGEVLRINGGSLI
ncbi:SDR family oxidoreductase [Paenibacillus sacheonensis]|uniref:SDR family oxidoreductase n=1 Tax=Paenibacillus sacheonensis TaxID=742054 RepID=A0A7X4YV53_9BACL|nr:NAD(P)-dependent dehydrogenase (short-subunit alcohol dehydrogenase family) [Paenibacillus sacheonensis]NBC72059.1 SDR family oxidoreductase [Paenibacillus sacheonensis]